MARIRSIKPEFWMDERLAGLPRDDRMLFLGLISHADDEGRQRGNPRIIKAQVFPYDDDITLPEIAASLERLEGRGFVAQYESDGERFLWLPSWSKHQKIDRPKPSALPAPPRSTARRSVDDESTTARRSVDDESTTARRSVDDESTTARRSVDDESLQEGRGRDQGREGKGGEPAPPGGGLELVIQDSEPKPRNASDQEGFWDWAQDQRRERTDVPEAWTVKQKNTRLGPIIRETSSDELSRAYLAFLEDDYWAGADPPWPMGGFLGQRSKYLSRARREAADA